MWQMLQVTGAIDREFSFALNKIAPVFGWSPQMSWIGALQSGIQLESFRDPPVEVYRFPLQRGYSRFPISVLSRSSDRQLERMRNILRERGPSKEADTPLICTTPYWASVAEQWEGPVVYYLTDLIAEYEGANGKLVRSLDRRMCQAATLVCPNSSRLGRYLANEAGCDPQRIEVVPNATRASNILNAPPRAPFPLPDDAADLPRPVAGVIGNLAGNMDWMLIREMVDSTPAFSWLFVGPYDMRIENPEQRRARSEVLAKQSRVRFTGHKPYGALRDYARSLDVALLPYFRREPTLSGSSTRFYEHLAACRPMLATPCFEELLEKQPCLQLVHTAREAVQFLKDLQVMGFDDGFTEERWNTSHEGTWEKRAAQISQALAKRAPQLGIESMDSILHVSTAAASR